MIKQQIIIGFLLLFIAPAICQTELRKKGGKDSIVPRENAPLSSPAGGQPLKDLHGGKEQTVPQGINGQVPDTSDQTKLPEFDQMPADQSSQIQKLKEEKKLVQVTNYFIISLLMLAFMISSFFFVRNRMKRKLAESELRNQKLESQQIRRELKGKQKDLTNLALEIARKNKLFTKTNDALAEIDLQQLPAEDQAKVRKLIQYNTSQLRINEDLEELLLNIEQVNADFFARLTDIAPDLTPSERQLCALLRLNLGSKDIASIRNISPKSVEMARYRLRKKLPIAAGDDIYAFIQKI